MGNACSATSQSHRQIVCPSAELVVPFRGDRCASRSTEQKVPHELAGGTLSQFAPTQSRHHCGSSMKYDDFQFIKFDRHPNGILLATLNRPEVMNATNARLHWELTKLWGVVHDDTSVKV